MQWQSAHSPQGTGSYSGRDSQGHVAHGLGPHCIMGSKSTGALAIVLGYAEEVGVGSFVGLENFQ